MILILVRRCWERCGGNSKAGMGKISLYDYLEKYVDIILYFSLSLSYIRMVKEGVRGWVLPTPAVDCMKNGWTVCD
jgi:hypothetical protein